MPILDKETYHVRAVPEGILLKSVAGPDLDLLQVLLGDEALLLNGINTLQCQG
jgi:hypothetical protein